MDDTGFRPAQARDPRSVPTTDTTGTRYRGSVHDPMARDMGGVSGNAGLFSTAEDLAHFASMLANDGRIYGHQFLQPETIRTFTTRGDVPESTRALGWDTKSVEGYSSAGSEFSASSFGHTGYTGTSFWVDPEQDLFAILLTNRVYPDDTDDRITDIRPVFADYVHRSIVGPAAPLLPGRGALPSPEPMSERDR
jgi:CubicO group peptidase (beta-lactamase class C family)